MYRVPPSLPESLVILPARQRAPQHVQYQEVEQRRPPLELLERYHVIHSNYWLLHVSSLVIASEGFFEDSLDDLGFRLGLAFLEAEEVEQATLEAGRDELLAEEL